MSTTLYSTVIGKTLPATAASTKSGSQKKKKGKKALASGSTGTCARLAPIKSTLLRGGYLREAPSMLLPLGLSIISRIEDHIVAGIEQIGSQEVRFASHNSHSQVELCELPKLWSCNYKDFPMLAHTRSMMYSNAGVSCNDLDGVVFSLDGKEVEDSMLKIRDSLFNSFSSFGLESRIWTVEDVDGYKWMCEEPSASDEQPASDKFFLCGGCGAARSCLHTSCDFEPFDQEGEEMKEKHDVLGENIIGVYPLAEFLGIDVKRTTKTIIFEEAIAANAEGNANEGSAGANISVVEDKGKGKEKEKDGESIPTKSKSNAQITRARKRRVVAALIRGDHEVDSVKLAHVAGVESGLILASKEVVMEVTGCVVGYAGPINLASEVLVIADNACKGRVNIECGANREHYHTLNANPGRDYTEPIYADVRSVKGGDTCSLCHKGKLQTVHGTCIGYQKRIKENKDVAAQPKGADNVPVPLTGMLWHVSGQDLFDAVILNCHDDASSSFVWPMSIAPFHISVIELQAHDRAENVCKKIEGMGMHDKRVLWDDRTSKINRKLTDSNLVGGSVRIVVGSRMEEGHVEISVRKRYADVNSRAFYWKWSDAENVDIDTMCHILSQKYVTLDAQATHTWKCTMTPDQDALFRLLKELDISSHTIHHAETLTCDAHAAALREIAADFDLNLYHLTHSVKSDTLPFKLTKSLLLKDRKKNYHLVVALADTSIDFKEISALEYVSGSVRLADRSDVKRLLRVPVGYVTPFSLMYAREVEVEIETDGAAEAAGAGESVASSVSSSSISKKMKLNVIIDGRMLNSDSNAVADPASGFHDQKCESEIYLGFHPLVPTATTVLSASDLLKFIRECGFVYTIY